MSERDRDDTEFPGLRRRSLERGVSWRFYKHWGQGYLAGEGVEQRQGDRSGCVHMINGMAWTNVPCVAQARLYESVKGWISAVYSYPHGIGIEDRYFWEVYSPQLLPDPERFWTEDEMERRILEVLAEEAEPAAEGGVRR